MRGLIPKGIVLGIVALVVASGCSRKAEHYETTVQILRTETVSDRRGTVVDVDLEYTDCPGDQREIFQGDAEFAKCLARYKVGEKLKATVAFAQMPDGHFDSEIDVIGECTRKRDALDERSYEVVHQCHDLRVNGVVVGFHCDRKPSKELLAKCPWFKRT
jgi:hypothetical protein